MPRSIVLVFALTLSAISLVFVGPVASAQPAALATPPPTQTPPTAATAATPAPIDINTATLEQLDSLPGIGPSKAAAIIAARERRPFRRLADLLRVPGIGRSTLTRLAPFLRFDTPTLPATSR